MAGGAGAGGRNAWEAASLVCRIATVGLSLASAIMTAASTKCLYRSDGSPAGAVSYSDYGSFKYSALANLLSAALQGAAIWLEVLGKEKWSKTVDLIDKLVLALTSTSAPLLLAVDNITSCGGGRRSRSRGVCDRAGSFCRQLRFASLPSIGSVGFTVAVQYTSWRAKDSSVSGQTHTQGRRREGAPPPGPGTVAEAEHTGGGRGGADDGHGGGPGGGGVREQSQDRGNGGGSGHDPEITSYPDIKDGRTSGGSEGGGDDGHGGGDTGGGERTLGYQGEFRFKTQEQKGKGNGGQSTTAGGGGATEEERSGGRGVVRGDPVSPGVPLNFFRRTGTPRWMSPLFGWLFRRG